MATTMERRTAKADGTPPIAERITVALTTRGARELQRLRQWSGLSKTDVVNRALSLYHFVADQEQAGRQLAVYDPIKQEFQLVHII